MTLGIWTSAARCLSSNLGSHPGSCRKGTMAEADRVPVLLHQVWGLTSTLS